MANGEDFATIGEGAGASGVAGAPMDISAEGAGNTASSLGSSFSIGSAASPAIALAGMTLSIIGGIEQAKVQKAEAKVSTDIAFNEMAISQQRENLANIIYGRQQTENFRKTQQNMALAKAAATNQGGGGGLQSSGYAGARAQDVAEGAYNETQLSENYQINQNIFEYTNQIDRDKIRLAQLGSSAATYAGLSSLGGAVTSSAMPIGRLSGGFGGTY